MKNINEVTGITKIALIPAFKPFAGFPEFTEELESFGFHVVAVDDGSGEEYAEIFGRIANSAKILRHAENLGKGTALKTGLSYISNKFHTPYIVVTANADGKYSPADIAAMAEAVGADDSALYIAGGDMPSKGGVLGFIGRMVFMAQKCGREKEEQSGLRAFSDRLAAEMIDVTGDRGEYELNVITELMKTGTPIREVKLSHPQPLDTELLAEPA